VSFISEAPKLAAFVRREFRITLSYRMDAVTGLVGIAGQVFAFSFLGKLVDPARYRCTAAPAPPTSSSWRLGFA
jgi:hypothetical protein